MEEMRIVQHYSFNAGKDINLMDCCLKAPNCLFSSTKWDLFKNQSTHAEAYKSKGQSSPILASKTTAFQNPSRELFVCYSFFPKTNVIPSCY